MKLFTKQKQSRGWRKQTYSNQGLSGWLGLNWEIWIDINTLPYIQQVTNKNLLYSIENSIQYSVMTYMGKESKNEKKEKSEYKYNLFTLLYT